MSASEEACEYMTCLREEWEALYSVRMAAANGFIYAYATGPSFYIARNGAITLNPVGDHIR